MSYRALYLAGTAGILLFGILAFSALFLKSFGYVAILSLLVIVSLGMHTWGKMGGGHLNQKK